MNIEYNFQVFYAFGLGYHDGRTKGYETAFLENMGADELEAYKRGYDAGANDFEMGGE